MRNAQENVVAKQSIHVQELKRRVIAEMDRHLGGRGTVMDLVIEKIPGATASAPSWGISEIRDESNPAALEKALAAVVPRMQELYDPVFE
jgi:hypothetical protein